MKNEYFDYFFDRNTDSYHRNADQVWNVSSGGYQWQIWVSGYYQHHQKGSVYNAFGKKHLLTYKGGKAADEDEGDVSKARRILDKRMKMQDPAYRDSDKYGLAAYQLERAAKAATLEPGNQPKYPGANALGGTAASVSTVVICDRLEPLELRTAFARALQGRKWRANEEMHGIDVIFEPKTGYKWCVLDVKAVTRKEEHYNGIDVTAYCTAVNAKDITVHIVHLKQAIEKA